MFRNWFAKLALVRMRRASRRAAGRASRNRLWRPRFDTLESRDVPSITAGPEFPVNTTTIGFQVGVRIAADAAGNYVAVWVSSGQDGSANGVYAQRYAADGSARGGEFPVNTYTIDNQLTPAIAVDAAGNFVIAWTSYDQDGSDFGIYAQRYAADGTILGGEFPVNNYTTNRQFYPSLAADAAGNFVIAWQSFGQDGSGEGVYAQRYAAD